MVEQVFQMTLTEEHLIEKVIIDENLHMMHVVLTQGETIQSHYTNATVYMTVLRGTLQIQFEDQSVATYSKGTVLKIPFHTKMQASHDGDVLELLIVKAPAPM